MLVTFDLDDTLMVCGKDYGQAFDRFGEFMADITDVTAEEAIDVVNRIDHENVEKFGLSMERFPESFGAAYDELVTDPVEEDRDYARSLGNSVFKTEAEYAERGFMDGAEELLTALRDHGFNMHVITAGDERVQQRKIDGLGLDRFFDETHIVPIDTKAQKLAELMEQTQYTEDETYLVGNSLTSDIKAALDADARGVYIPNNEWRPTDDEEYYHQHERVSIYPNLSELHADCPDVLYSNVPTKMLP